MTQLIRKTIACSILLATLTGCATVPDPVRDDMRENTEISSPTTKTLLTIGGILILGAILANQAEDNINDAIRNGAHK